MKKLLCWTMLAAYLCITAFAAQAEQPADEVRPPNIILIIGDDHGYPYFGFTGSEHVLTPNLDAIARTGVVFPVAHSTANMCRPTLQTLMTGLYPIQYDNTVEYLRREKQASSAVYDQADQKERDEWNRRFGFLAMQHFTTLPRLLAERGYASLQTGKWWEHSYKNGGFTEGMSKGWDLDSRGEPGWFEEFMGGEGMEIGRETMQPIHEFIDRHTDQPFFIWYAPSLPHVPLNPPYQYRKYYENTGLSESAKEYYANCTWFDAGVGDLLDYLHEKGLSENTLIVYINDNGWEQPPYVEYKGNRLLYSNGGNKGKLSLYDQSFRTPVLLHWPGHIDPKVLENELVSAVDIVPTLLDYAGLPIPENLPGYSLRSVIEKHQSLPRDYLIGRIIHVRSEDDMMGRITEGYYLRTRQWHFMWYADTDHQELYDMQADPDEDKNVIEEHPDLAQEFITKINAWRERVQSSAPQMINVAAGK